jgi:hypothetical protein
MKNTNFWDVTPCSLVKVSEENTAYISGVQEYVKQPARNRQQAALCLLLVYSLILKVEALLSSETLVNFYWTIRCHIPEDSSMHA